MSEEHAVSRRATLKSLGAAGAVVALGGLRAAAQQPDPKASASGPGRQTANVVDVAVGRMAKGHS
jgi:hypothetical protein